MFLPCQKNAGSVFDLQFYLQYVRSTSFMRCVFGRAYKKRKELSKVEELEVIIRCVGKRIDSCRCWQVFP